MSEPGPEGAPHFVLDEPDDRLEALLRRAQLGLIQHPVASQAIIRALVAEGRRFAQTDEGDTLRRQLAGSELVQRGRAVWEGLTLNMFTPDDRTALPSVLVDAVLGAATRDDLERVLAGLFSEGRAAKGEATRDDRS